MAIKIEGGNSGIVVEGTLNIKELSFEIGKGVSGAKGVSSDIEDAEIIPSTPEEAVREAVRFVLDMKDDDGDYIFKQKNQWFAIYRILVDNKLYTPGNYTAFSSFIQDLNIGEIRDGIDVMSKELIKYDFDIFAKPYSEWDIAKTENTTIYKRLDSVAAPFALKLSKLLP